MKTTSTIKHACALAAASLSLLCVNTLNAADFQFGYAVGSGLLGPTLFDTAASGGGDTGSSSDLGFVAEMTNLWAPGQNIKITGVALPIRTATTSAGTWTFTFYELNQGADANSYEGDVVETVVGTATVEMLADVTAIGPYYATFDTPIKFTAASSGIAVRFTTTGLMRLKINTSGAQRKNTATGATYGGNPFLRFTLAGSVEVPPAAGTLVWKGNVNGDWDVATANWDYALGDNTGFTTNYYDDGTFGPPVIFSDSLNPSFLNSNINLTTGTPLRPSSLTFANDIYGYDLAGPGKITGGTALTNQGTSTVTLNTANDFTGGSVLSNGRIRLGNVAGLSTGPITFDGGGLSSVGVTPLTINNPVFLSGAATLGDVTDNGLLTFPGTLDFNGGFSALNVKSDVLMSGVLTNGGIGGKSGPGTLTLNGQVTGTNGNWAVTDGLLIASGAGVQPLVGGLNVGASAANGVATVVITNGASVKLATGGSFALRVGAQGQSNPSSSNYLHLAGTLGFETNVSGVLGVGAFSAYDEVNMYPGSHLRVGQIPNQDGTATATTVININGGTIVALADNANFMTNHTAVNILGGGVTIDTDTNNITIGQSLLNGGGGGGLTKKGSGTLWLAGLNEYGGTTLVQEGTLGLYTGAILPATSPLILSNGAGLGLNLVGGYQSSDVSSVALNNSTISVDYGDLFSSPSYFAALSFNFGVGTVLNASGVNTIKLTGMNFGIGQYNIIQFASRTGSGSFVVDLPLGVVGSVITNGSYITVEITSAPQSLTWYGSADFSTANNNWDTTTLNWDSGAKKYSQSGVIGDNVTFNDFLFFDGVSGNYVTNVNLTQALQPASLTVDSMLHYVLSTTGSGKITGLTALTKRNTGGLTLSTVNDYTGGNSLEGGAVLLGNDQALGGGTIVLAGSALSSDGAAPRALTNALTLSAASTLGDATNNGSLTLSGPVDFAGAGQDLTVNSPATFSGSLTNGGLDEKAGPAPLTFSGVVGEQSAGQWQVEGGDFIISGGSITKLGGGLRIGATGVDGTARVVITNGAVVSFTGAGQNVRLGNSQAPAANATSTNILDVAATLAWSTSSGGYVLIGDVGQLAQINLLAGGLLQVGGFTAGVNPSEFNFNGGILSPTADQPAYLQGLTNAFIRAGGATIDTRGFNIGIAQPLLNGGGAGGLTKTGEGTLQLNGANTYTGLTLVSEGSLGGTGVIDGSVAIAAGGTLAPGASLGTLTINQNLTNAGTAFMELDASSRTADQVIGLINASYGGGLLVSNLSATPLAAGQVYQLFTASGIKSGNFASISVLGNGSAGLGGAFDPSTGQLTLVSAGLPQPYIDQVTLSGSSLILQGTNGTPSSSYSILTSTNVAEPLANWTTNTTGLFGAGGTFSNAIPVGSDPTRFFLIQTP